MSIKKISKYLTKKAKITIESNNLLISFFDILFKNQNRKFDQT